MAGMEAIKTFFKQDKFAEHVGIELLAVSEGCARASLEIKPHHLNAVGIVHGAAIFSLADLVFAMASNSHGTVAVAVNANISFMKAVQQRPPFCRSHRGFQKRQAGLLYHPHHG